MSLRQMIAETEARPLNGKMPTLPRREDLKMTLAYVKKNTKPALTLNGHTLINFGELFALIGLPGQGKSAICEAIIAAFLGADSFGFKFNSTGKRVLVIDTERPPDDVNDSYHNIFRRLDIAPQKDIEQLDYLTLSEFAKPEELKAILEREISTGDYELVILDGILDFSLSFLDDKDSSEVVKWARALAVKWNAALVVSMHPNKGTEMVAGHLGAFLYRWTRAMLFVRSVKGDKSVKELTGEPDQSKLSHADLGAVSPVYFGWDAAKGLLMPCDYTPPEDRGQEDKMQNAFKVVLANGKRMRYNELVNALVGIGHKKSTMKNWIKRGVDIDMLNNTSAIYSLKDNEGF